MIYQMDSWGNLLSQVPSHVTHLYGLVLNPMRGRCEEQRLVAASDSRDELKAMWDAERVEPYKDGQWQKVHRQGGLLEWFNAPWTDGDDPDQFGCGIIELRRDAWQRVA